MSEKLTAEQIIKAFENCELEKATLYLYDTKDEKVVFIPTVEIYELITRLCSENAELLNKIAESVRKNVELDVELKAMRGAANSYKAENKKLAKFKAYFDDLYGCNLEVLGWHENGNTISFDEFYDSAISEMDGTKQKECKDCLHYEACKGTYSSAKGDEDILYDFDGEMYANSGCEDFKDKALIIHLKAECERLLQKLQQAPSENREEFAEKIKAAFKCVISCSGGAVLDKVNKILKEMESSNNG